MFVFFVCRLQIENIGVFGGKLIIPIPSKITNTVRRHKRKLIEIEPASKFMCSFDFYSLVLKGKRSLS